MDWLALSDRALEILRLVVVPISLSLSHRQVAEVLQRDRPRTEHVTLPDPVTEEWVAARMREVRQAVRDVSE